MAVYRDILHQVEQLNAEEQRQLLTDLTALVYPPVPVEGTDEVIPADAIAESEAAWQDYLAGRDPGMPLEAVELEQFSLERTPDGQLRVRGTRVPLDCIIPAYQQGASAPEIVQRFPSLQLPDVHLILGYYLRHRQAIDDYLQTQQLKAQEIRQQVEARLGKPTELYERLQAKRQQHQAETADRFSQPSVSTQ